MLTKSKVHGYKNNVVSNFCQKRYPYMIDQKLEQEKNRGVYKSVNFRLFENLSKILKNIDSSDSEKKEAFLVLNEFANHPEQKVEMIQHDYVQICSDYLEIKNENIIYEVLRLLGSLVSIKLGRDKLNETIFTSLEILIEKAGKDCREVLGWFLCRLLSGDDGVNFILKNGFIQSMINSFFIFSKELELENLQFLTYLLSGFEILLQEDSAILSFIENGVLQHFLKLLVYLNQNVNFYPKFRNNLILLLLNCLASVTMNPYAKSEAVILNTVPVIANFLDYPEKNVINYAVRILMFISIHLEGKSQIIQFPNESLIIKLIENLNKNEDIKSNTIQLLVNLSENKKGMLIITKHLASIPKELIEIFDRECIISLYELVKPYTVQPFFSNEEDIKIVKKYFSCILEFVELQKEIEENYDRTILFINENINNFIGNILPFVLINTDIKFQTQIYELFYELISKDKLNLTNLKNKYKKLSNFICPFHNTTLVKEFQKNEVMFSLIS